MNKAYNTINEWRNGPAMELFRALGNGHMDTVAPETDRTEDLRDAFSALHINVDVVGAKHGPVITRYLVKTGEGVRVRDVRNNLEDIAMRLGVSKTSIRMECCEGCVGIEIPNQSRATVPCTAIVTPDESGKVKFGNMDIGMGVDIVGNAVKFDLRKAPHMLVAGQTGSGKSVFLNSMICNLLMNNNPWELSMYLVDPKGTEMQCYSGLKNVTVINNVSDAVKMLSQMVDRMESRYEKFTKMGRLLNRPVRTIDDYMECAGEDFAQFYMPRIVVVIDEVADLMACDKAGMEISISRIAAKARAAGIHLVLATQRPSRDVITGTIKANLPTRIAFRLPSQYDSKTILDEIGAESLLGKGDMLFKTTDGVTRLHGFWMSDGNIAKFVEEYRRQVGILTGDAEAA